MSCSLLLLRCVPVHYVLCSLLRGKIRQQRDGKTHLGSTLNYTENKPFPGLEYGISTQPIIREVGRCRFTVSNSVLKAPMVSALET